MPSEHSDTEPLCVDQTAKAIVSLHPGLSLVPDEDLRERVRDSIGETILIFT